jgi:hypothetical protein
MVETPDANSGETDHLRGTRPERSVLRFIVHLLAATFLGAAIAGGTIALGVWIGRHIDDKLILAAQDVLYALIPGAIVIVAGFALGAWWRQFARMLFLAVFAIGYTIIGVTTFHPSSEKLRFNDLVAEYIVHWAIVGAVAIPAAWLIGRLAIWKRKIARPQPQRGDRQ